MRPLFYSNLSIASLSRASPDSGLRSWGDKIPNEIIASQRRSRCLVRRRFLLRWFNLLIVYPYSEAAAVWLDHIGDIDGGIEPRGLASA